MTSTDDPAVLRTEIARVQDTLYAVEKKWKEVERRALAAEAEVEKWQEVANQLETQSHEWQRRATIAKWQAALKDDAQKGGEK